MSTCQLTNPGDDAAMCLKELIQEFVTALNEVKLVMKLVKIGTLYRAFHKLDNAVLFVETLAETVVSVDVR